MTRFGIGVTQANKTSRKKAARARRSLLTSAAPTWCQLLMLRAAYLNGIFCRPATEPLAPTSGISGPPLPKGASFLTIVLHSPELSIYHHCTRSRVN